MSLIIYLLAGALAGVLAGLLGVGGGIVIVPVLIMVFEAQGFASEFLTHMAIASSLACIVFTSASSVWSHHRKGAVHWPLLRPLAAGIILGAVLGVFSVLQIDGELLKRLIGAFAILLALKMMYKAGARTDRPLPGLAVLLPAGVFMGWLSTIFGIGGGTVSVPFLSRYRLSMAQVVATAAACGMPIAITGALTNIVLGAGQEGRPEWSLGYVYVPAVLGICIASVYFAKVGAHLAHKLPAQVLKQAFAALLLVVGLKFLFF